MEEDVRIKLFRGIEAGDIETVLACIEHGIRLDFVDKNGQTPLMLAAEKGHSDIVIELLSQNIDENYQDEDGWTALIIASKEGHNDVVSLLLEHGASHTICDIAGWSPLVWASYKGHHQIVRELIHYGANPNEKGQHNMTPLIWASGRGHTDVVNELILAGAKPNIADKYGTSALTWACRKGHIDVIKLLISQQSNLNAVGTHGWTPLIMAAKGGYLDVVELLLEENVNVNAVDQDGLTALSWASREGHDEIVLRLLNKGAFLNIPDKDGNTPLLLASYEGHARVVQALIDTYADLEMENVEGNTALLVAVDLGHTDVLRKLLNAGAKTDVTNKEGDTPLLVAVRKNLAKCVQILLEKEPADIAVLDKNGDTVIHIALRNQSCVMCDILLRDSKNAKLLNRPNKNGETPYMIDAMNKPSILSTLYDKNQLGQNDFDKMDPASQQELLITTIADFLVEPSLSIPISLGIYSRWGSGKSTYTQRLMELLEDFREQEPILAFSISMRLVISCILFGVSIGLFAWVTATWGDGIATAVCVVVVLLALFCFARIALVSTNERIHNIGVSLTKLFTRGLWFLKLVYCIPSSVEEIRPMLPVHIINVDLSHSIMINENPLLSIVNFIRELNDAIENDVGMVIPRLYRLFQAGPYRAKPGTSLRLKTRWKMTCCCIPSVLITAFVVACLWISLIFFGIYGITGPNTVMALLIACCCVLGVALLVYLLRICVMVYCFVLPMKKRVKLISTQAGIQEETFLSVIKQELDLCIDMLECIDGFAQRQTRVIINLDLIDSLEQQKVLNLVHSINLLLTESGHPFILIFSVDPRLLIKAVEQSLSTLPGPVVTPYEYLKSIIDLPFYIHESPKLKVEGALPESLHHLVDEHTFSDTEEIDENDLEWDRNGDLLSSVTNETIEINGHVSNGNGTLNPNERPLKLNASPNMSMKRGDERDDNYAEQDENIAEDISHLIRNNENGTLNDVRRIMNVVSLKGRILRNSEIAFQWNRIAIWVSLCDGWPYKSSWITLLCLDTSLNLPNRMSIKRVYTLFGYVMPSLGESDMNSSDGNANYFDTFIASHKPVLTVNDVRTYASVMFYIDPTIKKLMLDYIHAKSESSSKQPSLTQTLSRQNYAISPSSSKYMWRNTPNDDQFLLRMGTEDVVTQLSKIDGISDTYMSVYKGRIQENNINGRVLLTCDINELREAMQMTFGDWQLFKAWVISLRCPTEASLSQRNVEKASTYRSSSRNNSYMDGYQSESMPESPKNSYNSSINNPKLSSRLPALNEKSNVEAPYTNHSPPGSPTHSRKKYRKSASKLISVPKDESSKTKETSSGGDSSRWHRSADSGFASADVDPNNRLQQNQLSKNMRLNNSSNKIVEHLNLSATAPGNKVVVDIENTDIDVLKNDTWNTKTENIFSNPYNTSDALSSTSSQDDLLPPPLPNGDINDVTSRKKWTFAKFSDGEESQCETLDIEKISKVVENPSKSCDNTSRRSKNNSIHRNNFNNNNKKNRPISLSEVPLPPPGMLEDTGNWPMNPPAGFDDISDNEELPSPPPSGERKIAFQSSKLRSLSSYKSSTDDSTEKTPLNPK